MSTRQKFIFILSFAVTLLFSVNLFAAHGPAGCGWGTSLWEGKTGVMAHISAATTNGSSANQTFGISSGTAGCDATEKVTSNAKIEKFVAANMENLATDIAKGSGEYLDTLATLYEINSDSEFSNLLQKNFSKIYTSDSVSSNEVVKNIDSVLKS